jgi:hypothetical protein
MKEVARNLFEPVRLHFGVRIYVSSFYRCKKLNTIIGGSDTSDHMTGNAIDVDADWYNEKLSDETILTNAMIFHWIKENLKFDQLIWEYGDAKNPAWVHMSWRSKTTNRNEIKQASKVELGNGRSKTVYLPWDI